MMKRILLLTVLSLAYLGSAAQGLYVATDKSCYLAGEEIGCSAFCAPGPAVAYLELVSSEGSAAAVKLALQDGRGAGTLRIPFDTPTGNYRLAAWLPGMEPDSGSGPVISVFNTFSTARVRNGVVITDKPAAAPVPVQTGYGISADTVRDSVIISNLSGQDVSLCISLFREDSLQGETRGPISSFSFSGPGERSFGETLSGCLSGPGAPASGSVILAVPGSKTDCYQVMPDDEGRFSVQTENIFGDVDLVCIPPIGSKDCHVEVDSPFRCPAATGLPQLELSRSMEGDLLRRSAALRTKLATDTLAMTLPMRRDHFFLEKECTSYILDDYTRFPTMEEVFVEIIPFAKMRHRNGKTKIYVLINGAVMDSAPRWGEAMVMVDGVPVPDGSLIESYDPSLVKTLDVYPYKYNLGGTEFDGVINLVTFKGNMPGLLFDDNVRIYGFHGCSYPVAFEGSETLFWHPLVSLPAGGRIAIPCSGASEGSCCTLRVEGLNAGGRAVYFRKTFVR